MKPKSSKKKTGSHKDEDMDTSLQLRCSWLEGQAEVFTLPEIQKMMKSFSELGEVYSVPWLEKELQVKYKDLIYELPGCQLKYISEIWQTVSFRMPGKGIINTTLKKKANVSSQLLPT